MTVADHQPQYRMEEAPASTVPVEATVAGMRIVVHRRNIEEEETVEPNFFDADFTIAASTGSLMWEGSWACIEQLRQPESWLSQRLRGAKVVELGSGIGLLGLCAAAVGASVLLTDVPSVVTSTLSDNVAANHRDALVLAPPPTTSPAGSHRWEDAGSVGAGSAAAQPLDWTVPLAQQTAPHDPREADVVLAAECVWLRDLVPPFVQTVCALLSSPRRPRCVMAFRERATAQSTTFSSAREVLGAFTEAGCEVVALGDYDAPESRGLLTGFYEIRWASG